MTKISRKPVDPELMSSYVNNLWSVFAMIKGKDDIKLLFKDLFTHTEYKMFAKRLEIARRLLEGETYESIMDHLKVTERTISAVSNILERAGQGFRLASQKIEQIEKEFQRNRANRQNRLERRNLWYKGVRL